MKHIAVCSAHSSEEIVFKPVCVARMTILPLNFNINTGMLLYFVHFVSVEQSTSKRQNSSSRDGVSQANQLHCDLLMLETDDNGCIQRTNSTHEVT